MKGTFFSADFIKDSSGNLRLLELNTDTVLIKEELPSVNWAGFINTLATNNITELDVVYKPYLHQHLVDALKVEVETSATFITAFNIFPEDSNTVYPSQVEDSDSKFVLRIAYDEAAIFDSVYCKNRLNTYKLFVQDESQSKVTQFYYSSAEGTINTLSNTLNAPNIPDATIKDIDESFNPIDFYKIGHSEQTAEERWTGFIADNPGDDKLIEQFHFASDSLENNHLTSYRSFFIVYGSTLDIINIHSYKNTAMFEIPSDISSEVDNSKYTNKLGDHHYFEYTTNTFKQDGAGLLSTVKLEMADNTSKAFGDINVGEEIKSYFISGSPQVESDYSTLHWEAEGPFYPEGSHLTSSAVVYKNTEDLHYNALIETVVDGDSLFSGTAKHFLVYDSSSNKSSFKHATELDPAIHYFFKMDGTIVDLDEVNYYVTTDTDLKIVELDVEDTDTYIISGSTAFNAVVSHNAPCFVAGTKISLPDGSFKNIEDVKTGDEVVTFNFSKGIKENRIVKGLSQKSSSRIIKYTFNDGTELLTTDDHPLYSPDENWVSNDPVFTTNRYNFLTKQIEVGTGILKSDGTVATIVSIEKQEPATVYNLLSVEANHNFFANEFLVHNRCFIAGTEITLANGDVKNIEDVVVGEEVLTYNEDKRETEAGVVGELKKHEVDSVIRLTLDNENIIVTTAEHPFYVVDGGWVKAGELQPLDVCLKEDGKESLISSVEVLEEKHEVFNLLSVSENHNFFANKILVHNK